MVLMRKHGTQNVNTGMVLTADLHWGGFTTQWGDKKRINGILPRQGLWAQSPKSYRLFRGGG